MPSIRHGQIAVGQPLSRTLQGVVFHTGMFDRFEVVSFPDQETYEIKVVGPDGIELFRVEIKFPDQFALTLFDDFGNQMGGKRYCKDSNNLAKDAKEVLEGLLCTEFFKLIKSHR